MSQRSDSNGGQRNGQGLVDRLVRRAGGMLARDSSRRSFLGKTGATVAGLAGIGALGWQEEAQAACTLPNGCFGDVDVNVCYSPWTVIAAESGQTGVVLRKGPSLSAAPVTRADTGTAIVIPVGGHFARCSNRTGSVANGCPDPGPRPSQNGFLWGYWVGYQRQGWMPYSVSGVTYAVGDNGWSGTLCGPAQLDFDCRKAKSACIEYVGCGGGAGNTPTCSETYRPVVAVGTDLSQEKYYLRYAANSTTFAWLVPGDRVKRWAYKSGAGYTWSCVQVICAAYAPNGCRGWVRSDALGSPITDNSPCYPNTSCPAGSSG